MSGMAAIPAARRRLKRATRELVEDVGGLEAAGADVGRGKSTVHRWTDRNEGEHFVNVADLAVLEAVASRPFVTETLCRLAGGVFVPLPDIAADPETLAGMVLRLTARLGEVSREMAAALADDGIVDRREAERLLELQHDHDVVAAQLRLALETIAGRDFGAERDLGHGEKRT